MYLWVHRALQPEQSGWEVHFRPMTDNRKWMGTNQNSLSDTPIKNSLKNEDYKLEKVREHICNPDVGTGTQKYSIRNWKMIMNFINFVLNLV